ncbi:exodeoxyribonuclease V subunit gamma [Moraxella marmotae]|uniref:exodeoxyribonuclease V subunit gamma n=1 Tax=Moraxella marmotae TaxID=3344520 RepID=UPI0035F47425
MFKITQSNDTTKLLEHLVDAYQQTKASAGTSLGAAAFAKFTVIVPSMVLGDWLTQAVADKIGISTLFTAQFWGQYQWQMIQKVLQVDARHLPNDALQVPEVAVLSGSVMRWRIFGYISAISSDDLARILADDTHPLYTLLTGLYDSQSQSLPEHRLWQSCDELAAVYVRYLTHRLEWLHAWTHGLDLPVSVGQMLADKDRFGSQYGDTEPTPDWLVAQYENLERLLRYLWQQLFSAVYAYREALEERFWQVLDGVRGEPIRQQAQASLPQTLYLFTVQQIPSVELQFLKRLSVHIDVHLLHFNPSQMFWADIVDKNWLATQRIINPNHVYLKDHGHTLLSRLGKESRETFAMLADMSGGEFYYEKAANEHLSYPHHQMLEPMPQNWQVDWQDDFVANRSTGLLHQLKQDILMLEDTHAKTWLDNHMLGVLNFEQELQNKIKPNSQMQLSDEIQDLPSLSIHACHNLKRQLEVARIIIAKYLNQPNADGSRRKLSDVVVYLPDVAEAQDLIRLVFAEGVGVDGLNLPAKITGTTNRQIDELMQAISGFYTLLGQKGSRFYREDFFEWLMMPAVYESFGVSFDDVSRACQLLTDAGFVRGFDARHMAQTLDTADKDYRYSFAYALDRIVLGFLSPSESASPNRLLYPFDWQSHEFAEASLPLVGVNLADAHIVDMLCRIYQGMSALQDEYTKVDLVEHWLNHIETQVINRYFGIWHETSQMRAIFEAMNSIAANIRANKQYHKHIHTAQNPAQPICLSLQFVLESISQLLSAQAVSAEPAGVITFARFGALRSIPFGLTVMLDMNLSAFPRQERIMRMDLMKAGLKRRGDRSGEDDDNGAFLDALLCSRDACAIFYTSQADDGTELLPASPVSELLEFFKSNVDWQMPVMNIDNAKNAKNADNTNNDNNQTMAIQSQIIDIAPALVESYLKTHHTATAFDKAVFYQDSHGASGEQGDSQADSTDAKAMVAAFIKRQIDAAKDKISQQMPPAPFWVQIRQILDSKQPAPPSKVAITNADTYDKITQAFIDANQGDERPLVQLLDDYQLVLPSSLDINQIHQNLKNPAITYLKNKLPMFAEEVMEQGEEPLALSSLDNYLIKDELIDAMAQGVFDDLPMDSFSYQSVLDKLNSWADLSTDNLPKQQTATKVFSAYFDNRLPAGANRLTALDAQVSALADLTAMFAQSLADRGGTDFGQLAHQLDKLAYSSMITQTSECHLSITLGQMQIAISAKTPPADAKAWLSVLPNTARASHFLRYYLHHLAWQVRRNGQTDDIAHGRGFSYWQFNKASDDIDALVSKDASLIVLRPVPADAARRQLANFVAMGFLMQACPVVLPVMPALTMAALAAKNQLTFDEKTFGAWLNGNYDEHYSSAAWQLLLGANPPLDELQKAAELAKVLYGEILASIEPDTDDKDG